MIGWNGDQQGRWWRHSKSDQGISSKSCVIWPARRGVSAPTPQLIHDGAASQRRRGVSTGVSERAGDARWRALRQEGCAPPGLRGAPAARMGASGSLVSQSEDLIYVRAGCAGARLAHAGVGCIRSARHGRRGRQGQGRAASAGGETGPSSASCRETSSPLPVLL